MKEISLKTKRGFVKANIFGNKEYSPEDVQTIVLDNLIGSIRENANGYELYLYEISESDNSYFFIKSIKLENTDKMSLGDITLKILIDDYNEYSWIYDKEKIIDARFIEDEMFHWLKKVI